MSDDTESPTTPQIEMPLWFFTAILATSCGLSAAAGGLYATGSPGWAAVAAAGPVVFVIRGLLDSTLGKEVLPE